MTAAPIPGQITPPRVAFLDPRTGMISRAWYRWLLSMFNASGSTTTIVETNNASQPEGFYDAIISAVAQAASTQIQADVLSQYLSDLTARTITAPAPIDISPLWDAIEALQLAPPPRQPVSPRFGMFYDTTTQSAALINTAYAVTFNSTMSSYGISVASSSRVTVDRPDRYNVQWSIHPNNSGGSLKNVWSWLRKNGTDIPYTLVHSTIVALGAQSQVGGRHLIQLAAGEYVEIYWATDDTGITLAPDAASAFYPAGPSATVSMTDSFAHSEIQP